MKTGIEIIAEERQRQITMEGWSAEHDDQHEVGELADAAMCYCMSPIWRPANNFPPLGWPWIGGDNDGFKPSPDRIKELAKSGALIAAEIDRLQRLNASGSDTGK